MTVTLRIFLIIGIVVYFFVVYRLLKKKILNLKYSLLWIAMGCVFCCLIIIPNLLQLISSIIGIKEEMNGLFSMAILFILMLLMALTSIVSKQSYKIKEIVQANALLEKRVRDMEKERNEEKGE